MSTVTTRWAPPPEVNASDTTRLEHELKLPRLVCQLLAQRGLTDVAAAKTFLRPSLSHFHDPSLLTGVDELVERLVAARDRGDTVGIHGDYDVDGITSASLYTKVLASWGWTTRAYVPHRMEDGYGVATRALSQFHAEGIKVLLTCDVGSSAATEISQAIDQYGMEVLVTDHHHIPERLPGAHVFVNPHQEGDRYPYKDLCGVGVAFKVLQALARRLGKDEAVDLYPYLDLVAVGTIADVVPLTGENRVIVRYGLAALRRTRNHGLAALLRVADIPRDKVTEWTVSHQIGPRLNASGRIDAAARSLACLMADSPEEANIIASEIDELNKERRALSASIEEQAVAIVESWTDLDDRYSIVLFDPETEGRPRWHHGVVGIVASRIVERYGRPAFLFGRDEKTGKFKGSGRAPKVGSLHLYHALDQCAEFFDPAQGGKFGGHAGAAGATLSSPDPVRLAGFVKAFDKAAASMMSAEDRIPVLGVDLEVSLDDLSLDLHKVIQHFAPFGEGNRPLRLMARQVEVTAMRPDRKGAGHCFFRMRATPEKGSPELEAVAWSLTKRYPDASALLPPYKADVLFGLSVNEYQGRVSLQLMIDDIRLPLVHDRRLTPTAAKRPQEAMQEAPPPDDPNAGSRAVSPSSARPASTNQPPKRAPAPGGFGSPR